MNKKLKELIEKADLEALDIYEAHPNFPKECYPLGFYNDTRDKILVGLIVKECVNCVPCDEISVEPPFDSVLSVILQNIVDDMKNQFGVDSSLLSC